MKEARQEAWSRGVDDGPPPGKGKAASAKRGSSESVIRSASNNAIADNRQQHLEAVTAAFSAIADAECNRLEAYIVAGEKLVQARDAGAPGTWLAWLNEHFPQSEDTAARAAECWRHRDLLRERFRTRAEFSLRKALEFIKQQKRPNGRPPAGKPKPTTKTELQKRIQHLEDTIACKNAVIEAKATAIEPVVDQPVDVPVVDTSELRRQAKDARAESDRSRARSDAFNKIGRVSTEELYAPERELLTQLEFVVGRYLVGEPSDGWISAAKVLNRLYDKITSREITAETHRDRWPGYVDGRSQQYEIEAAVTPPAGER